MKSETSWTIQSSEHSYCYHVWEFIGLRQGWFLWTLLKFWKTFYWGNGEHEGRGGGAETGFLSKCRTIRENSKWQATFKSRNKSRERNKSENGTGKEHEYNYLSSPLLTSPAARTSHPVVTVITLASPLPDTNRALIASTLISGLVVTLSAIQQCDWMLNWVTHWTHFFFHLTTSQQIQQCDWLLLFLDRGNGYSTSSMETTNSRSNNSSSNKMPQDGGSSTGKKKKGYWYNVRSSCF